MLFKHFRFTFKEHFFQMGYVIPTLLFPAIFFVFFGVPETKTVAAANTLLASFSAFAVFGVAFFQNMIATANERHHTWNLYLKTLPVNRLTLVAARTINVGVFSLMSVLLVYVAALQWTPTDVSFQQLVWLSLALLVGSIPFALLGSLLGTWCSPKSAAPIGNLVYLLMSYMGGLWFPPQALPENIQKISPYLTTRVYGEVLWDITLNRPTQFSLWGTLMLHTVLIVFFISMSFWIKQKIWVKELA